MKRVGDKTQLEPTQNMSDTVFSTTIQMLRLDKTARLTNLSPIIKQLNLKGGPLCQTLSNALQISNDTLRDSPDS